MSHRGSSVHRICLHNHPFHHRGRIPWYICQW